jgi:hypothetical protein
MSAMHTASPIRAYIKTIASCTHRRRELYAQYRPAIDDWEWREVRRRRGEMAQRILAPLGITFDLQEWAEQRAKTRRIRWAKARRRGY